VNRSPDTPGSPVLTSPAFEHGDGVYLLTHSVGRPPRDSAGAFDAMFHAPWRGAGEPWSAWMGVIDEFCAVLARLLGARADDICPQPDVSTAFTRVLRCVPSLTDRREVLLSTRDFPSLGFVAAGLQNLGLTLRFLPADADESDPQQWRAAITDNTAVVLVTQVQSNTGVQVPAAEICAAVRERGALAIVDAAQAAGIVAIDVTAIGADFLVGSCVKWLCGGPGAGFLWVAPDIVARCEPGALGWFSHADPFEFDIHSFRYHHGAKRFWGGTPSVAPCAIAAHSITRLLEIGIESIRRHNLALGDRLRAGVAPECRISPAAADRRGGTVVLDFADRNDRVAQALADAGVHVDRRRRGFRFSPHVCNDVDDIDEVLGVLRGAGVGSG
jgi:kynureninase